MPALKPQRPESMIACVDVWSKILWPSSDMRIILLEQSGGGESVVEPTQTSVQVCQPWELAGSRKDAHGLKPLALALDCR